MGYVMYTRGSSFSIQANDLEEALAAIQKANLLDGDLPLSFEEAMKRLGWEISFDSYGNVDEVWTSGKKLGDDSALFQAIAPLVLEDSYIEMRGEDDEIWRWYFCNKKCYEQDGTIVWEGPPFGRTK